MKRFISLLILVIVATAAMAQSGRVVRGVVLDSNNQPIANALVNAVGAQESTTTGADGMFIFNVPTYAREVRASFEGYLPVTLEVDGSYLIFKLKVDSNYAKSKEQARIAAQKKAEAERIAQERAAEQARVAAEKEAAAKAKAEEEARIAAQKKAEAERIAAEKKAEAERIAQERAAEQARVAAEKEAAAKAKAEEEARIAAQKKAEAERIAAQKKAEAERIAAEKEAAARAKAEKRADKDEESARELTKEQSLDTRKDSFFVSFNVAMPSLKPADMGFGPMLGWSRRVGAYTKLTFSKKPDCTPLKPGYDIYWSGEYRVSQNAVTAGVLVKLCKPLYLYAGAGASWGDVVVESALSGNYYNVSKYSKVSIDGGILLRLKMITLNGGVLYTPAMGCSCNVGIGVCF